MTFIFWSIAPVLCPPVQACDSEDLVQDLYNATLQNNCFQNSTSCVSSCISGHVLKDGNHTTNHVCNGTSWTPSTVTCLRKLIFNLRKRKKITLPLNRTCPGCILFCVLLGNFSDDMETSPNLHCVSNSHMFTLFNEVRPWMFDSERLLKVDNFT